MSCRGQYSWFFWLFSLPFVVVTLVFLIGGSRLLINPTAISVTPCGDVVVTRNYPLSEWFGFRRPWVRYVQTVTPITVGHRGGYLCREDNALGQRYSHDGKLGFGAWNVGHFANECIDDPVGFVYECKWTAYLFDIIPLRPVSMSVKVPAVEGGCLRNGPSG